MLALIESDPSNLTSAQDVAAWKAGDVPSVLVVGARVSAIAGEYSARLAEVNLGPVLPRSNVCYPILEPQAARLMSCGCVPGDGVGGRARSRRRSAARGRQ
jgi:hypothetical protein